jgi:type I restriction enzyme M protein
MIRDRLRDPAGERSIWWFSLMKNNKAKGYNRNGDLEFADQLWATANKLRGSVEAAEYKHIVLGLLFLKYVSDAFETRRRELETAP